MNPANRAGFFKNQIQNPQDEIPKQVRDDKRREPNYPVMLNLFQHLVCYFLPLADASFIPVHRTGFSDALLINPNIRHQASTSNLKPQKNLILVRFNI